MKFWPETLMWREFRPREVHKLTGHEADTIRKWGERFDFSRTSDIFRDRYRPDATAPATRWWTWQGVQMLCVFGDVLKDTGDHRFARAAVMRDRTNAGDVDIFAFDYRNREGNDLLAVCDISAGHDLIGSGESPRFLTCAMEQLPAAMTNMGTHERLYCYNLSAMQRRLAAKLEAMDNAG